MYFKVTNLNNLSDIELEFSLLNSSNLIGLSAFERYNCIRLVLAILDSSIQAITDISFDKVSIIINKDEIIHTITYTQLTNKFYYSSCQYNNNNHLAILNFIE
ncbi:hypothetical protein CTM76_08920 [Photobacterium phosphoreum]|jgi:hypothetical protein|nr:hypothetical protein UB41_03375 [Photobacterium phosphoreum]OBU39719.1 hypothetical protein AYY25_02630 [Photobacterium phosphoreum]PQJ86056.1 hypothetical protein BTO21_14605 [Photobacterium phosphoreum]PSU37636.1 hypothetical protein CTM85_12005 [Photobacterium phosphoreum]PSU78266.1 hypothetical protein CTM76_08920 [Photobacterium phosphoreum]